jgi:hypothetical protein
MAAISERKEVGGVPFITNKGNLNKTNRRTMTHGRRGLVSAVWYGEQLTIRGRMLSMRYAERSTMTQYLAVRPTALLTV